MLDVQLERVERTLAPISEISRITNGSDCCQILGTPSLYVPHHGSWQAFSTLKFSRMECQTLYPRRAPRSFDSPLAIRSS